ncbi:MAG: hypothetical protein K8H89_02760 [Flavobacteriales bacterium]|nr:hypothetical protein [Flavobacteriales bacterium]
MKVSRALAFFGFVLTIYSAYGQECDSARYEFVKENGKPKFLKCYRSLELHLKDSLPPIARVERIHQVDGDLLYTTNDSLVISLREERWSERVLDPHMDWSVRGQGHWLYTKDTLDIRRSYALSRIDHVTYDSNIKGAGPIIAVLSALGLLVYAPLKAMKFKDGTFDGDKYIQVATPCLIGVGVGLVVMPFTEGKRRVNVKLGT